MSRLALVALLALASPAFADELDGTGSVVFARGA